MNLIKTLFFMILVPFPLLVWVPYKIALSGPGWRFYPEPLHYAALLPWLAGTLILLWSALDFVLKGKGTPVPVDPPRILVVEGPYRFTRNPMYLGVGLILLGHVLWFESMRLLIYAAVLAVGFHLFVVFFEEPVLRRKFGDSYEAYCRRVPRWLPRLRPL
ncbi:MAG: isoprenylcysteine carboxylmethyltransferase family protein [Thermodesulfobacteriota bacterium]